MIIGTPCCSKTYEIIKNIPLLTTLNLNIKNFHCSHCYKKYSEREIELHRKKHGIVLMGCPDCGRGEGYVEMNEKGYFCTNCANHWKEKEKRESNNMKWIKCSDQLPSKGVVVLLYQTYPPDTSFNLRADPLRENFTRLGGMRYDGMFVDYQDQYGDPLKYITHWMPLPEKPNE